MRRDKDTFDPSQPALLVTYGNTARKHRHLDKNVIVLGRSNVCDLSLVSPEVAPVHCVLVRVAEGWKLRDCSGRPGTRVNGRLVDETYLEDADVIQIGAFTFQAHLPSGQALAAPAMSPSMVERLQRSRQRLAERALALRRKLAQREHADVRFASKEVELALQAEAMRVRQREYELRMTRLELSERDLTTDRATLEKEYRTLQEDIQRHTTDVQLFTEEAARKSKELEERRLAVQNELDALMKQWHERDGVPASPGAAAEERTRELDRRAKELDHLARHLRKLRQRAFPVQPPAQAPHAPEPHPSPIPALELLAQIVDSSREQHEEIGRMLENLRGMLREVGQRELLPAESC
jgi:hypothetical protein